MVEALLEGVDADLPPLLERGRRVLLADALDAQVLERVGHVGLRDVHAAHAVLAQAWKEMHLKYFLCPVQKDFSDVILLEQREYFSIREKRKQLMLRSMNGKRS